MPCAIVVHIRDYQALFEDYGLSYCLDALATALDEGEEAHLLVAAGFELIPPEVVAAFAERGVRITDAGDLYQAIIADNPWLERVTALRPFDQICFLRHLLLERFFAGERVLASDADVVWRVSPYRIARLWTGGSFALDGSPCVTFARADWFEAYRAGLRLWCEQEDFGDGYSQGGPGRHGVAHDQDLLQHLAHQGLIEQDEGSARASPEAAAYCFTANPLLIERGMPEDRRTGLVFSRADGEERVSGRIVPFWHMQTGFSRYLAHYLIATELLPGSYRIPASKFSAGDGRLADDALRLVHKMLLKGQASGRNPGRFQSRLKRGAVYRDFFETDLAFAVFDDAVWWRPGVFAPRQAG